MTRLHLVFHLGKFEEITHSYNQGYTSYFLGKLGSISFLGHYPKSHKQRSQELIPSMN